jgi:hypothetical protein
MDNLKNMITASNNNTLDKLHINDHFKQCFKTPEHTETFINLILDKKQYIRLNNVDKHINRRYKDVYKFNISNKDFDITDYINKSVEECEEMLKKDLILYLKKGKADLFMLFSRSTEFRLLLIDIIGRKLNINIDTDLISVDKSKYGDNIKFHDTIKQMINKTFNYKAPYNYVNLLSLYSKQIKNLYPNIIIKTNKNNKRYNKKKYTIHNIQNKQLNIIKDILKYKNEKPKTVKKSNTISEYMFIDDDSYSSIELNEEDNKQLNEHNKRLNPYYEDDNKLVCEINYIDDDLDYGIDEHELVEPIEKRNKPNKKINMTLNITDDF